MKKAKGFFKGPWKIGARICTKTWNSHSIMTRKRGITRHSINFLHTKTKWILGRYWMSDAGQGLMLNSMQKKTWTLVFMEWILGAIFRQYPLGIMTFQIYTTLEGTHLTCHWKIKLWIRSSLWEYFTTHQILKNV